MEKQDNKSDMHVHWRARSHVDFTWRAEYRTVYMYDTKYSFASTSQPLLQPLILLISQASYTKP